jgi:hypothetical protein
VNIPTALKYMNEDSYKRSQEANEEQVVNDAQLRFTSRICDLEACLSVYRFSQPLHLEKF